LTSDSKGDAANTTAVTLLASDNLDLTAIKKGSSTGTIDAKYGTTGGLIHQYLLDKILFLDFNIHRKTPLFWEVFFFSIIFDFFFVFTYNIKLMIKITFIV
jgi:hypothetical protein